MVGSFVRLAAAALLCAALAACASGPSTDYGGDYGDYARRPAPPSPNSALQCVPYARDHSAIALFGDAYTWWDQAEGKYARASAPSEGAVLVLFNYAGPERGHLAVVRRIVSEREIRVDHANWLDDGEIFTNDPVRDVSADNDWSVVRVFNVRTGAWGTHDYPVQGFIGPGAEDNPVAVARRSAPGPVRMAQRPRQAPDAAAGTHDYVADLLEHDPAFSPPPADDEQPVLPPEPDEPGSDSQQ